MSGWLASTGLTRLPRTSRSLPRGSAKIDATWPRCLELGLDIVLDLNFWTRCERDAARMKARLLGAGVRLYRLNCPEEVAWQRIERRNVALDGSSLLITRNTFEELKTRFEPLDPDEEREDLAF